MSEGKGRDPEAGPARDRSSHEIAGSAESRDRYGLTRIDSRAKYALQAGYVPRFEILGLANLLFLQTKIMGAEEIIKRKFSRRFNEDAVNDREWILNKILLDGSGQDPELEDLMRDLQKYSVYHH